MALFSRALRGTAVNSFRARRVSLSFSDTSHMSIVSTSYHSHTRSTVLIDATAVIKSWRTVQVQWHDGHTSMYNFIWLRVNCPSNRHDSGQRIKSPGDIDGAVIPKEIVTSEGSEDVDIIWSDDHVSRFRASWLRAHDNSSDALHDRSYGSWPVPLCSWDSIPKVDAGKYMNEDGGLYSALMKVNKSGMCILDNAGTKKEHVTALAKRIGPVSHSCLYGDIFEVKGEVCEVEGGEGSNFFLQYSTDLLP
ncbi:unnamed protein product [Choristocarpus tenellus]